jgi:hypothetical protein
MKLTNLTTALFFLATTACGAVVDPTDDAEPSPGEHALEEPPVNGDLDEPTPPASLPFLIEAPRAATSSDSLFTMTFDNAPIDEVVQSAGRRRIDVVEQKIVTINASEIQLTIELAPPTGSYMRTLVSDTLRNGGTYTDQVLCESNNIATYDPRCETAAPVAREMPSTGPITAASWTLTVFDEVTGFVVTSCISPAANKLTCVLPPRASAGYRIIASADGFADLWDANASPAFGPYAAAGQSFFGGWAPQPDWQCWDWRVSGSSMWCAARYEFVRFTAIDRARLDFDPITLRLSADGGTVAMATPALSWDPGNDDVPGPNY